MSNWSEIVTAWAAWVNGNGPPVQFKYNGKWIEQGNRYSINQSGAVEWRVKPPRTFARLLKYGSRIDHVTKIEGEPDPIILHNARWIGEWQEIPE